MWVLVNVFVRGMCRTHSHVAGKCWCVVIVVGTNYLELNMGLDLVLVANMLVLSKDKVVVADVVVVVVADYAGDDDYDAAADAAAAAAAADDDFENVVDDDGHLWSDL